MELHFARSLLAPQQFRADLIFHQKILSWGDMFAIWTAQFCFSESLLRGKFITYISVTRDLDKEHNWSYSETKQEKSPLEISRLI